MRDVPEQLTLFDSIQINQKPEPKNIQGLEGMAIRVARGSGLRVSTIKWKTNRQVMASVGKGGVLNLHTIYMRAGEGDIKALAKVLSGRADSHDRIEFHDFIEKHLPSEIKLTQSRVKVIQPRGMYRDLTKSYEVVSKLLNKILDPKPVIGWSAARVGRNQITWGTHRETSDGPLILINSILDDPDTPNHVIEHIIWHELCHQLAPPLNGKNGRRHIHSEEFKKLERRYPRWKEAEKWETDNVNRLIRKHWRTMYR